MIVKLQAEKQSVRVELPDSGKFAALVEVLAAKLQTNDLHVDILVGYPPKVVGAEETDSLASLGIQSGAVITVRPNAKKKTIADALTTCGFDVTLCRKVVTMCDIDTITVEEAVELCAQFAATEGEQVSQPKVVRKVIAADNSCLFNAIEYLMSSGQPTAVGSTPMLYRQVVADAVMQDTEAITEDMLEKPRAAYAAWIVQPDKWGGEVELFALARHTGVEIAAVDIRSGNLLVYSPKAVDTPATERNRIYVIYDGTHYDAVVREKGPLKNAKEVTIFNAHDTDTAQAVQELARSLREQKQFVNLSSGALQCKVCFACVAGEAAAVEHAKQTGHQNFGQVE